MKVISSGSGSTDACLALQALEACGVDVCGEGEEFHTFVTDEPLFSHPLRIVPTGHFSREYGYTFLAFNLA